MLTLAFMGPTEWMVVLAVVLLLFGGRKLPQLARSMGSSITQFKKGLNEPDPSELDEGSGGAGGAGGESPEKETS